MKIFRYLIFFSLLFSLPSAVRAADLEVIFKPQPLLADFNFAPAEIISAYAQVTNHASQEKALAVKAINVADPDNFASALNLAISHADQVYFNASLADFFNSQAVALSTLASGQTASYQFMITFNEQTGNDYQGKVLDNFDILIGFEGEEGGAVVISGTGGGGYHYSDLTANRDNTTNNVPTSTAINWPVPGQELPLFVKETPANNNAQQESLPELAGMQAPWIEASPANNIQQGESQGRVAGEQAVLSEKDLLPETAAVTKDKVSPSQPIPPRIYILILILCLLTLLFYYRPWLKKQK